MGDGNSRRDQIMDAIEKDQKRRRRERALIVLGAVLVAGLLYLVGHVSRIAESSTLIQPFIIYFFYFAVWALLLVLILVLVFLIVRNIVKYIFERKRGVLGARLRMRLVMAFMMLTLGPAAVLFVLSVFILNTSIERLYTPHVINVANTSKEVIEIATSLSTVSKSMIEAKYKSDGEDVLHFAQEISRSVLEKEWIDIITVEAGATADGSGLANGSTIQVEKTDAEIERDAQIQLKREEFQKFIDYKRSEYNLTFISVFGKNGKESAHSSIKDAPLPKVPESDIKKALSGEEGYTPPVPVGDSAVLYSFFPIPRRGGGGTTEIEGVVVTGAYTSWIPEEEWAKLKGIEDANAVLEDYETLHKWEIPIKFSYFILLVFVTLIVIFLAIWFGFFTAKGITEPIQLLAEGTEMVASGNLDYRIEVPKRGAEDEISVLVKSFNKMTKDLSDNRAELDEVHNNLRKTNIELEQRRQYIETVLAHVSAGVISIDAEKRALTINRVGVSMLGKKDKSEVTGRHISDILSSEQNEIMESMAKDLEKSGREMVERQITFSQDKRTVVSLITMSKLVDEEGKSLGFVIVIDDMTELVRAHRAMAWREVARRIAHEIKNPLTPIQLAAQRLQRRYAKVLTGEDASVFTESTGTIIRQVEELKHLVNEFSLFARLPSTQPVASNLHDLIKEVLPLYKEAHPRINFELIEDPNVPLVELDQEQMKRVFINLLDNAAASIEKDGAIIIETMFNSKLQIIRIEIRDTGHGIPGHVKDRLFEPYYSTKVGGTGLGLTIVQRIIADHYGYIRVHDNKPKGTCFVIELPAVLSERQLKPKDRAKTM